MMQDHRGNFVSPNIRGTVYAISKEVSTDDIELSFHRSDLSVTYPDGKRPETAQQMFTVWSKSINWKDKRNAQDGLEALSRITQRARANNFDGFGENWSQEYTEYDSRIDELERDCAREGLLYDRGSGAITIDPDAHTADFVELDLDVMFYDSMVVKAQRDLNDAIREDITSWAVADKCKYLVEAVCKVILSRSVPEQYASLKNSYLNTLTKAVSDYLGLKEGKNSSPAMKDFAQGLQKLSDGIAQVRNRTDEDHPQILIDPPSVEEVRLSLDVTHAWCRFIVSEYRKKLAEPPF